MLKPRPLTDTHVRSLKPTGQRYEVPDAGLAGLALRITAKGAKTWSVTYRVRGAGETGGDRVARLAGDKRRLTLGDYPTVGLAKARAEAAEVKRLARSGIDASAARRSAVDQGSEPTVIDLVNRYVMDHLRRNRLRAGANAEKQLRLYIAKAWGSRPLASIVRGDLVGLLEDVRVPRMIAVHDGDRTEFRKRGGPGAGAEVRKWTRAMFQFAVDAGLRTDNPFIDVKNRDRQRRRDRVLTMEELAAVWDTAGALSYPWGPYYRLILLTGDRRSEWARARWDWLDAECTRLEIPGTEYKTGKTQVVPLSQQARSVVRSLPKAGAGPFLFSSDGGAKPVSGFSKAKARLDQLLVCRGRNLDDWVVHDLRRSMATHMERIGIEPHVIEVCLGHVLKGVAATYRQYGYLPEKAAALQAWADELQGACVAESAASNNTGAPSESATFGCPPVRGDHLAGE